MRLTDKMLDAMLTALSELLAGEGPQGGEDEQEADEIMANAAKAHSWIHHERQRRTARREKWRNRRRPIQLGDSD